jgi:hypothetical protein
MLRRELCAAHRTTQGSITGAVSRRTHHEAALFFVVRFQESLYIR